MTTPRLSGLDVVFLSAETPSRHLHTMAVLILDPATVPGGYAFETFRDFIAQRLPAVPPLRRRVREVPFGLARPVWVDDPGLDVEYHVRRAAIPRPGGPRELAALAAEIDERPLDRSRPLWEMVVVEGVADGRIAVLAKLQHALMDGIAGVQFMTAFFGREPELEELDVDATEPGRLPSVLELLAGAISSLVFQPMHLARAGRNTLYSFLRSRLERPLRDAADDSPVAVPRSCFNTRISSRRNVAYVSVPLAEIKAVARSFDATVNDVVLAMVSGALRSYLAARGELPAEPLVAAVPASTHADGDERANAYTIFQASLATDLEDPAERLRAIRAASRKRKREQRARGMSSLAEWADVPSPFIFSLIAIVSNVPGPPVPLYFGGARLLGIHPIGPIYDGLTINITALSREDCLDIGLVTCRELLPDLWEIADALADALAELTALTRAESDAPEPAIVSAEPSAPTTARA
jgi:WS/DGAT/MGAT family acyltransferase